MNDPLAQVLPSTFHFVSMNGSVFVLLIAFMLFFGSVGGRIFQKLHIPQVVGYIVIGILLGSSGMQILGKDAISALNPLSTIALALIGFLVGAELKIDVLKKYGKQFIGILLGESITPFFVVAIVVGTTTYLFTHDAKKSVSFGLLLGAICSATAPAATTDVLKEFHSRGPLTTTTLGIVAMDDAVALILYAVASTIATPLLGGHSVSFGRQLIAIAHDIFGSIAVGAGFGFILSLILKNMMDDSGRILGFSLGILFLSTGICDLIHLDHILAAMSIGFFIVNFAPPKTRSLFKIVDSFTPPVYVLFFVIVGAKLNIWIVTPFVGLIAILYVLSRTIGKSIGARFGALVTGAPVTVKKYLPFCLLSQAGVAIGLSIAAGNDFPHSVGPQIMLIVTATTFIVQILGPVCVKHGIDKAGEVGLDITEDDIIKKSKISDVTNGCCSPICSTVSPSIVNDTDTIGTIITSFTTHENMNYVVRGNDGKLTGIISLDHIKEVLQIGDFAMNLLAMDIMDKPEVTCTPELPLSDAYRLFADNDTEAIPIVDAERRPMGIFEKYTVDHYIHTQVIALKHKLESLG